MDADFKDSLFDGSRSTYLYSCAMGVSGIAEKKISGVKDYMAVGFTLQGEKVVLFYEFFLLHIVNEIYIDLLGAPEHEVQVQILPVGLPEPVFRSGGLILHDVDKQFIAVNRMAALFIAEEVVLRA